MFQSPYGKVKHVRGYVKGVDLRNNRLEFVNISSSFPVTAKIEDNKTNEYSHGFVDNVQSESIHYDALVLAVGGFPLLPFSTV